MIPKNTNLDMISDQGVFWTPSNPNVKMPGSIERKDTKSPFRVSLQRPSTQAYKEIEVNEIRILHGQTVLLGKITLMEIERKGYRECNKGIPISYFDVYRLIIGDNIDDNEFCDQAIRIRLEYEGVQGWCPIRRYLLQNSRSADRIGLKGWFKSLRMLSPFGTKWKEKTFEEKECDIILQADMLFSKHFQDMVFTKYWDIQISFISTSYNEVERTIRHFSNLLVLCWGLPAIIKCCEIFREGKEGMRLLSPQYTCTLDNIENSYLYPILWKSFLHHKGKLISLWFELVEKAEMVVSILIEHYYTNYVQHNSGFLAICRALEAYYAVAADIESPFRNNPKKWNTIVDQMINAVRQDIGKQRNIDSLRKQLIHLNELSLEGKLNRLRKIIGSRIEGKIRCSADSIHDIVSVRNDMTHKCLADHSIDVFKLYCKVHLFLLACILKHVGLDDDEVLHAIEVNNVYRYIK